MHFCFWGHERLSDRLLSKRYPKSDAAHELKKVQLQECFMLMIHDSIGHLKTLCMSILSLGGGIEFEWKRYSSLLSIQKMLVF